MDPSPLASQSADISSENSQADPLDPNWKQNSYGVNYERLLSIKQKYDPDGLFYAHHAVGSDDWIEKQDGRLCRVSAQKNGVENEL